MESDLEKFMKQTKPKQSKLIEFEAEIVALRDKRYSIRQITKFLNEYKEVKVSARTVERFFKNEILPNKVIKVRVEEKKEEAKESTNSAANFFTSHVFGERA